MTTFPAPVVAALHPARSERLEFAWSALSQLADGFPKTNTWAALVPVVAGSPGLANPEEVLAWLQADSGERDASWSFVSGELADGRPLLLATDLLQDQGPTRTAITLSLFDVHPRMAAWALTAFWRAQELGDTLVESLGKWRVIAAASVARALIEGAAAFVVEARAMTDEWRDMKAAGPPDWTTAHSFRAALNQVLGQAQFGTRLGPDHLSGINKGKHLERTNVLTLLDKFGKITGHPEKVEDWYAWLCDATHPSYGFQAAYTTANLVHVARVQMLVQASTDPAEVRAAEPGATQPTIAHASAEASAFALEQIAEHLPRFIAVVDDYGLTTGVPFVSRLDYFRRLDEPARNDPCPCGSGRKFKACVHAWGSPLLDPRT